MRPYMLMLQADEDDRQFTQAILDELTPDFSMQFAVGLEDLPAAIAAYGEPSVILINNQDHRHKAIEIVKQLKKNPGLDHIPLVVLGEITTPDYTRKYYRAGVNTYITKPSSMDRMQKKIRLFLDYWYEVAEIHQQQALHQ